MLDCKFLRICAKLEDPAQLDGFKGWGLQFMAAKLNGMGLELVESEAKVSFFLENTVVDRF